LNTNCTI